MAITVLTNVQVILNSVDLSNHVTSVTVEESYADVDTTAFGQTSKTRIAGLGDHKLTLDMQNDLAAASVYATIQPLVGSTCSFNVKTLNQATSSVNPAFTGVVLVNDFKPVSGKVGDLNVTSITWPVSGSITTAIT
jgi:hypothetical protein